MSHRGASPVRVLERERTPAERARYMLARGRTLLADGEIDRALATLREGAEAFPGDVRLHLELARGLYQERDYDAVVAHLTEVEDRFASEPDLFVLTAASLQALGHDARAVDYFERAVRLRPDDDALREALNAARRRSERREC